MSISVLSKPILRKISLYNRSAVNYFGGHSIAPKTASANAANAKVRNRQMIGRPIILKVRLSYVRLPWARLS